MGTNELGEKTVKCVANRNRLFYFQRMLSAGDEFECEARAALNWARTGAVTIVQEKPTLKAPPPPVVDPTLAAVAKAAGEVKPPHEAHTDSTAKQAEGKVEVAPEAKPEAVVATAPAKPEVAKQPAARYDRRDLRAKS